MCKHTPAPPLLKGSMNKCGGKSCKVSSEEPGARGLKPRARGSPGRSATSLVTKIGLHIWQGHGPGERPSPMPFPHTLRAQLHTHCVGSCLLPQLHQVLTKTFLAPSSQLGPSPSSTPGVCI